METVGQIRKRLVTHRTRCLLSYAALARDVTERVRPRKKVSPQTLQAFIRETQVPQEMTVEVIRRYLDVVTVKKRLP